MKKLTILMAFCALALAACTSETTETTDDSNQESESENNTEESSEDNSEEEETENEEAQSDLSEDEAALASSIGGNFASDQTYASEENQTCIGEAVVNEVGIDTLTEAGVTAESAEGMDQIDISEDLARSIIDCVGAETMFKEVLAGEPDTNEEVIDCFVKEFGVEQFKESYIPAIASEFDDEYAEQTFNDRTDAANEKCGTEL